jgi:archaellum component FlaC
MPFTSVESDTIEDWEERVRKLKEQITAIEEEIDRIEHEFPFTYRDKLNDQEWIAAQKEEIRVRIERLQEEKERLEKIVEVLRQQANEESDN